MRQYFGSEVVKRDAYDERQTLASETIFAIVAVPLKATTNVDPLQLNKACTKLSLYNCEIRRVQEDKQIGDLHVSSHWIWLNLENCTLRSNLATLDHFRRREDEKGKSTLVCRRSSAMTSHCSNSYIFMAVFISSAWLSMAICTQKTN